MVRITGHPQSLTIDDMSVRIARTEGGVIELWADDHLQLAAGLGFAHAYDRLVQMMVLRLLGQGRIGECLHGGEEALQADVFLRTLGLFQHASREVAECTPLALQTAEAYCRGVQHYLAHFRRPVELALLRYQPEPWTVADCLLIIKLLSYAGMAQCQQEIEKFIVEAIRNGVDVERLKRLFAPHLDGLSGDAVEVIRRLQLFPSPGWPKLPFLQAIPTLSASNNWVVAGTRTDSGFPFECHDPHLLCDRLPQAWYEAVRHVGDHYEIGITAPGLPCQLMGRNNNVSVGLTYGFMDTIDYFVEDCRAGKCRRRDEWRDFDTRTETIRRRNQPPTTITVRENEHGVLECDPRQAVLADGLYLCRAWSALRTGAAQSLDAACRLQTVGSVREAQAILKTLALSANWVVADRQGNIGYQQSGRLPARPHSGLYPLLAWEEGSQWDGCVAPDKLACCLNPPEGFIATANDDWNAPAGPLAVNLSMGSDRAGRIAELLRCKERFSLADMKQMQRDVYSKQAERYLRLLRRLLPLDSPSGELLGAWDLRYDANSRGATLFEAIYEELLAEVFGAGLFGRQAWVTLAAETSLLSYYFHVFDRALLDEPNPGDDSMWFAQGGREATLRRVLERVLERAPMSEIPPWGERHSVVFKNLVLGDRLPRFVGFDYGPVPLEGCRGSIVQTAVGRWGGQPIAVAPTYRFVTDLGTDQAETALAGGPSGKAFSPFYANGLQAWLRYEYKVLRGR